MDDCEKFLRYSIFYLLGININKKFSTVYILGIKY